MKISYLSSFDATDITSYSGTGYYIPQKLKEYGDTIDFIGNLSKLNPTFYKFKKKAYNILGKNYLIERNPKVLDKWAKESLKKLSAKTDVLVAYSSQPYARLKSNKPQVFWSDAIFGNMVNYYGVYSNLCKESINDGNAMEQSALDNATVAVFSSDWAANAAKQYYTVDESKIKVVTYGANIDINYTIKDIEDRAKQKPNNICKLLFLGVEWYRKGGDIAVKVAKKLNEMGLKTELSIVGIKPNDDIAKLDFIKSYGFISKSTPEGKKLLNDIIADSHFLILPTRADCTPIVFSEFNAHGIPVISTTEGGIPSLVKDGINGFLFDKETNPSTFAQNILNIIKDKKGYLSLSKSSFNEYQTRLNWQHSIKQFRDILKEL